MAQILDLYVIVSQIITVSGSYIVEFNIPTYLGLYPSFLVFSPSYLGLKA
jgi:hypothetical protein